MADNGFHGEIKGEIVDQSGLLQIIDVSKIDDKKTRDSFIHIHQMLDDLRTGRKKLNLVHPNSIEGIQRRNKVESYERISSRVG